MAYFVASRYGSTNICQRLTSTAIQQHHQQKETKKTTTLPKANILLMAEILHQLRLVVYLFIYKVSYIPGGAGFPPSTVVPKTRPSQKGNVIFQLSIFRCSVGFREGNKHTPLHIFYPKHPEKMSCLPLWRVDLFDSPFSLKQSN